MTLGIVILNYLAYQDTLECVASIEQQTYQEYKIVIVENASTNESYEVLKTQYEHNDKVVILKTTENLGFAKGNNFGIDYLKKMNIYNCLVINGDTLMIQPDYLEQLAQVQVDADVAMIGGRIISRDNQNQNTLPVSLLSKKNLRKNRMELFLLNFIYKWTTNNILDKLKTSKNKRKQNDEVEQSNHIASAILNPEVSMLHGSAIYFTENYLKKYIGFYPETFLYYEEEFLALTCRKLGYKQAYMDELEIFHKEDASSNLLMNNDHRKSVLFKLNIIKENIKLMDQALDMSQGEFKKRMSHL